MNTKPRYTLTVEALADDSRPGEVRSLPLLWDRGGRMWPHHERGQRLRGRLSPSSCGVDLSETKLANKTNRRIEAMEFIREISGYCIQWGVYGKSDTTLQGGADIQFCFLSGCFDESLRGDHEITLTQDCMHAPVFARRSDGTLSLSTDDVGLIVTAQLIDTPHNRALLHKIDTHRIRGWSHCWDGDLLGGRYRAVGETKYVDFFKAHLTEVSLVVHKRPRMEKTAPKFLTGGPETKGTCP